MGSSGINDAADVTATVDAGYCADLNSRWLDPTAVAATGVTEITGTASAIATAIGSSGITDAADVTATVDAGSVAAADLNTIVKTTTTSVAPLAAESPALRQQLRRRWAHLALLMLPM